MANSITEIKDDISKLDEIRLAINELLKQGQSTQDNEALLALLEREYKLPAKVRNEIIALVEGRKTGNQSTKAQPSENRREIQNICGECYKVGVKFEDKEGNFIGLEELKKRVAVKKSQLGAKLKTLL